MSVTSDVQVGLTWQPGASDNGSPVIDYQLSYDQGIDDYIVLASGITVTSFVASSLQPGFTYKFKVESRNLVGYSVYSNEAVILAAKIPDQPIGLANDPAITD